jgi:hypothetical protein
LTQKNCNTFKIALKRLFNKEKIPSQGLHRQELTNLIQSALTKCKREKNRKSETNFFSVGKPSGERARPIKVIMSSIPDKQILLSKKQLLRGSHFFLDEDLTIRQQEERKEELL